MAIKLRMYQEGSHSAILEDTEGREFKINIVAEMDYEGRTYCAYYEENGADMQHADIMELFHDAEGNKIFMTIEDQAHYDKIADLFVRIMEEALPDPSKAH
jgi:uncharacterized protein YrzB (UPF0473 family)